MISWRFGAWCLMLRAPSYIRTDIQVNEADRYLGQNTSLLYLLHGRNNSLQLLQVSLMCIPFGP